MDLYNINLAIRYKADECGLCKEQVGSRHYIDGCKHIERLEKLVSVKDFQGRKLKKKTDARRAICQWAVWKWHCLVSHNEEKKSTSTTGMNNEVAKMWKSFLK